MEISGQHINRVTSLTTNLIMQCARFILSENLNKKYKNEQYINLQGKSQGYEHQNFYTKKPKP